jgi:exopolysaccharide biosynthesis polyprenyl glycosylphosphotransferase
MRKYLYLAYDLSCICVALIAALYLRHGFPLIQEGRPEDLYLILLVTLSVGVIILPLMQTHSTMWRFTSSSELTSIMIAVALIALISNSSMFLISRLEMMPRSVPPMHWAIAVFVMCGSRLIARRIFGHTRGSKPSSKQHVIVIGATQTAELYLQFIKNIIQHPVVVEGFLDDDKRLTDWMFQKHKILGTPKDLPHIIEQLNVHGIHIKQVVLAELIDNLPKATKKLLLKMERNKQIELLHFSKYIGPQLRSRTKRAAADYYHKTSSLSHNVYEKPTGFYPYFKRLFDIVVGLALIVLLSPVMLITALLIACDIGFPLLFWQQRPGQYGKPFRLYKFRTMRKAGRKLEEDRLQHKSGDKKRTSLVGKLLRRLRLDEFPQLIHIITGSMSFVGPRPLLPDDQPPHGEVRLSIRPGVTGWAQIHGGDALTSEEKLVLDVWYIRNMSLWLDIRILLRTLVVVLKEDAQQKVKSHR